jgi:predicted membrane channel-forming protein YqfA (hemolysin III family)
MPNDSKPEFRKIIFLAISLIALGIVMTTNLLEFKPIGFVLIAAGGLFFIIGMKKKSDNEKNNRQ